MRTCTLCNTLKDINCFAIKRSYYDGLSPWCKECKAKRDKADYQKTKERRLKKAQEYYEENKDKVLERRKNDPATREYNKQWNIDNKDHVKDYNKQYKTENAEQIRKRRQSYRIENREYINDYEKDKIKTDPLFKLGKMLRARLTDFLKDNKQFNKRKTADYVGCSREELKMHIEEKFKPGMTWENHGDIWHLDHIIPLAHAKTENQLYELAKWSNIQPLFVRENLTKQTKITDNTCWQKVRRDNLLVEDIKNGCPMDTKASEFILNEELITDEHRKFIERYEWLGTCGFGVRYVFTARYNGLLGGVVMVAEPNSFQFDKKLEALIQRGACASWTPKNLGSRLVMFACRWMVSNTDKRIFTAYSDPEAGEIGTIYQACNFDYLGQYYGSDFSYKLSNGKLVSDRYFTRTSSMKKWAKELGIQWLPEWNKDNGFQNIHVIPIEIRQQLNLYAKQKKDECPRVKKLPKGKYVLLLTKRGEKLEKTWEKESYPKRNSK